MTVALRRGQALIALVLAAASLVYAAGPASAVSYAQIEGTGSTWSQVIVQQWISDEAANGLKVVYTGGGSSKGRKDFANYLNDFAISEVPFQPEDGIPLPLKRQFGYLPIVAGGTAFTYQILVGGKKVTNLRLSGDTIAKIFTNKITNWNDPAITKDNNGKAMPDLKIVPVVRSDGSGTTAQFTGWLDKQYSSIWRPFFGKAGSTSYYPKKGSATSANGSDQVMNTISSAQGNGTIGYVEYSYPVNKGYPVVKVENKAGYYVEPTQYNVAVALTKAVVDTKSPPTSQNYLTSILTDVYTNPDPRAYPISSYSYMLLPVGNTDTRFQGSTGTAKRNTLAEYVSYALCDGQKKAGPYGYSPLPLNLAKAGMDQVKRLTAADKAMDPKIVSKVDVTKCGNPTFDGKNLSKNVLASIAPQPQACDKDGAGPCNGGTGAAPTTVEQAKSGTGDTGATTGDSTGGSTDAPSDAGAVDPATGTVTTDTAQAAGPGSAAVATRLSSARPGDTTLFGSLAAIELLLVILTPGVGVAIWRRWSTQRGATK